MSIGSAKADLQPPGKGGSGVVLGCLCGGAHFGCTVCECVTGDGQIQFLFPEAGGPSRGNGIGNSCGRGFELAEFSGEFGRQVDCRTRTGVRRWRLNCLYRRLAFALQMNALHRRGRHVPSVAWLRTVSRKSVLCQANGKRPRQRREAYARRSTKGGPAALRAWPAPRDCVLSRSAGRRHPKRQFGCCAFFMRRLTS
jgi:hypothetical protein